MQFRHVCSALRCYLLSNMRAHVSCQWVNNRWYKTQWDMDLLTFEQSILRFSFQFHSYWMYNFKSWEWSWNENYCKLMKLRFWDRVARRQHDCSFHVFNSLKMTTIGLPSSCATIHLNLLNNIFFSFLVCSFTRSLVYTIRLFWVWSMRIYDFYDIISHFNFECSLLVLSF